jgi:heme/copper-type cytochrome/quinol oxidase subunit 2
MAQTIALVGLRLSEKRGVVRIPLKDWIPLQGILFSLMIPFMPLWLIRWAGIQHMSFWIPRPSAASLADILLTYGGSVWLLISLLLLIILWLITKKDRGPGFALSAAGSNTFLSAWLFTPIIVPLIISFVSAPVYHTKYTILASPAFFLLAALGLRRLPQQR